MSQVQEPVLKGGCRCGDITYMSTSLPMSFTHCHCNTCRKLSGAPFLTFGDIFSSSITFQGPITTTFYSSLAERTHCSKCGTPISMRYKSEPELVWITAGSIDEGSVKGKLPFPGQHIFLKEKATWYQLPNDGITRHEGFPQ